MESVWYNKNTYDDHGRLSTSKLRNDSTVESNKQYTYDSNGRLTQIYLAHEGVYRNNTYDAKGRLTSSYI